jgi:hypothetical protein
VKNFFFFFFLDECNLLQPLTIVQYQFSGEEHAVVKLPHGNSKRSTPYKRTKQSTLRRLKEVCETKNPSDACAIVEHEMGGILNADSSGSIPRRRQQASDIRRKLFKTR